MNTSEEQSTNPDSPAWMTGWSPKCLIFVSNERPFFFLLQRLPLRRGAKTKRKWTDTGLDKPEGRDRGSLGRASQGKRFPIYLFKSHEAELGGELRCCAANRCFQKRKRTKQERLRDSKGLMHEGFYLKVGDGEPWAGQVRAKLSDWSSLYAARLDLEENFGIELPTGSAKRQLSPPPHVMHQMLPT